MTALAMILSILLVSVTVYNIQILESERAFIQTKLSWFQTNLLLQKARTDILEDLRNGRISNGDQATMTYASGTVEYYVTEDKSGVYGIRFESDGVEFGRGTSLLYYDYVNHKVIQWVVV